MKRLSLMAIIIVLLITSTWYFTRQKEAPITPAPSAVQTEVAEQISSQEEKADRPRPIPRPPVAPKELTYDDYKEKVLRQLDKIKDFETSTSITVKASGGGFLMPSFDVKVDKELIHESHPLFTHVKVDTEGPFFLNLGPARFEIYTKDDKVYVYDEKSGDYIQRTDYKPHRVREMYDGETSMQKKLWKEEKMDLQAGNRLTVRLALEGADARRLIGNVFGKYGISLDFDESSEPETASLLMEYDPKSYFPKEMKMEGSAGAMGYQLRFDIRVTYDNVK